MTEQTNHLEGTGVIVGGELIGSALIGLADPGAAFRLSLRSGDDELKTVVRAVDRRFVDFYPDCHVYADFLAAHGGTEVHFTIDRHE